MAVPLFIVSCLVLSIGVYAFLLWNSKVSIKKKNDKGERWASQSKPIFGGIGFFAAFLFSVIYYVLFIDAAAVDSVLFWTLVAGVAIGFFTGLVDDTKSSSPYFKFGMQLFIGVLFVVTGNHINAFQSPWLNYVLTVFWVVALMNSLNMLDNMDAITSSVSAVVLSGMIAVGLSRSANLLMPFICLGVVVSLLAFLRWNWNPSKMYMGDNGSQFLGAFVAFAGIQLIWNHKGMVPATVPYREIDAVLLSFIVPISDTATVSINRMKAGKSPFVGGRDHTTHHLYYLGLSERKVALTLIAISIVFNIAAFYILCVAETFGVTQALSWSLVALVVFAGLYSTTIFAKPK